MAQLPPLDNAPVKLELLRKQAQQDLISALDSMPGRKVLVLDPKLSGPLALIAQISLLKEHGVDNLSYLDASPPSSDCRNVMYFVRPRFGLMKLISSHIHHYVKQKQERRYSIYFTPRRSVVCEKVLEEEGVHDVVSIGDFPLYAIPFDDDVMSLELELSFKECQVDGDTGSLWCLARSIYKLQALFGVIPSVKGKGKAAAQVFDILTRMQKEQPCGNAAVGQPQIQTMILLDRQVDMVTPMCTQLTYEGVIDEFLGINNGVVELDPLLLGEEKRDRKLKVPLNSNDKVYRDLRDSNFAFVGQSLRDKAVSMKQDYVDVKTVAELSEIKNFVKKINALPELTRHIQIVHYLTSLTSKPSFQTKLGMEQTLVEGHNYDECYQHIEELIWKQEPLINVMRFLVLFSLTQNGLPKKHFDYFRREILHSYGFEHIFFLNNLEKAGLFKRQETKSNWLAIKRGLDIVIDGNDADPTDISYVFSGTAPLSVRLVQHCLTGGWRSLDNIMKLLPGPTFERKQQLRSSNLSDSCTTEGANADGQRALVLVVFIGGVTFAEISALRFLSAQDSMKYDVLVLTTKLVNGNSILQTLLETPC